MMCDRCRHCKQYDLDISDEMDRAENYLMDHFGEILGDETIDTLMDDATHYVFWPSHAHRIMHFVSACVARLHEAECR